MGGGCLHTSEPKVSSLLLLASTEAAEYKQDHFHWPGWLAEELIHRKKITPTNCSGTEYSARSRCEGVYGGWGLGTLIAHGVGNSTPIRSWWAEEHGICELASGGGRYMCLNWTAPLKNSAKSLALVSALGLDSGASWRLRFTLPQRPKGRHG